MHYNTNALIKIQMLEMMEWPLINRLFMSVCNKYKDTTFGVWTDTNAQEFQFSSHLHIYTEQTCVKDDDLRGTYMSVRNKHVSIAVI